MSNTRNKADRFSNFYHEDNYLDLRFGCLKHHDILSLIKFLEKNPHITSLNLGYTQIEDRDVIALASNKTLTTLSARGNYIGAIGALVLAENKTLRSLNISYNVIKNAGALALAKNKTLTSLDVSDNWIGNEGAMAFVKNHSLMQLKIDINPIGASYKAALDKKLEANREATKMVIVESLSKTVKDSTQEASFFKIASLVLSYQSAKNTPNPNTLFSSSPTSAPSQKPELCDKLAKINIGS